MADNTQERSRRGASGLVFVGFLILGLSIGLFGGNFAGGIFVGLGAGFTAMGIMRAITGEW